jgi:hypothetical protein
MSTQSPKFAVDTETEKEMLIHSLSRTFMHYRYVEEQFNRIFFCRTCSTVWRQ